jgi:hypothetical protein
MLVLKDYALVESLYGLGDAQDLKQEDPKERKTKTNDKSYRGQSTRPF